MAIFGDLSDMSAPEVLHMLGARTGKLFINTKAGKKFELHLREGMILSFQDDGFSILDTVSLRRSVKALLEMRAGKFEFSQTSLKALAHEVSFTREEILQIAADLQPQQDTLGSEHIPDQATRFRLKNGFNADVRLPDDLRDFMQRSHDHLFSGCSASELASALRLSVPQVQIYFQRLRSLDRITPVRAYATNYGGYTSSFSSYSSMPPRAMAMESAPPSSYVRPPSATVKYTPAPPRPKKGLIQRLLSVFSFGGK